MKVDLNERVAIVTGGAHGIGRAIVQALSDNGAHIVIVDIDGEAGEKSRERDQRRRWRVYVASRGRIRCGTDGSCRRADHGSPWTD